MTKILISTLVLFSALNTFASDDEAIYKLVVIEDQRDHQNSFIDEALKNDSVEVLKQTLRTIGRIQDPARVDSVKRFMAHADTGVRTAAAQALGLIGTAKARSALKQHLSSTNDAATKSAVATALGHAGTPEDVEFFSKLIIESQDTTVLEGAAHGLGMLLTWKAREAKVSTELVDRLLALVAMGGTLSDEAAFALARIRTELPDFDENLLYGAANSTDSDVARALLARTLGKVKTDQARRMFVYWIRYPENLLVRVAALRAIQGWELDEELSGLITESLASPDMQVAQQTIETIATFGKIPRLMKRAVLRIFHETESAWLKATALRTLFVIDNAQARSFVKSQLFSANELMQTTAISLFSGMITTTTDVQTLVRLTRNLKLNVASGALEALGKINKLQVTPKVEAALKAALSRKEESILTSAANSIKSLGLKVFAPDLALALDNGTEAKIPLLEALAQLGTQNEVSSIEKAFKHHSKQVIEAAVAAYKARTGQDMSHLIPLNSRALLPTPSQAELAKAQKAQITFRLSRGSFTIKMLGVAPVTAYRVYEWAKNDFYQEKTFHRVISNFVAQGGGFDTGDNIIRDEVGSLRHTRGIVGIATSGKDTGGANFFVNHTSNLHLDGHYTAFAQVSGGMNSVDRIEVGTVIKDVRVSRVR